MLVIYIQILIQIHDADLWEDAMNLLETPIRIFKEFNYNLIMRACEFI